MMARKPTTTTNEPQNLAGTRARQGSGHRDTGAIIAGVSISPERTTTPTREILIATAEELPFVIDLQKRFSNALGFIPTAGLEWYVDNRRVLLAVENGQPAGYLLGRNAFRWQPACRPITQAAICYDAQRRKAGFALVRRVEDAARCAHQDAIQAMCREDLESNQFWKAAGFEEIGRYQPENARKKEMICWRKLLSPHRPYWFDQMPPYVGYKAKRRRHAQTQQQLFPTQSGDLRYR